MSKRLQVLLPDEEMAAIQRTADDEKLPVGEWVRRAIREKQGRKPVRSAEVKLAAMRKALTLNLPTCDIEQMNAEILQGYLRDWPE